MIEREHAPLYAAELIAFAFLFDVPPSTLFPKLFEDVIDEVVRKAGLMDLRLDDSPTGNHKRRLLQPLPARSQSEPYRVS